MKRGKRTTRTATNRLNEEAALYRAMLKAGWWRKPKLPPAEFARRLAQEQVLQQRGLTRGWRARVRRVIREQFGPPGRASRANENGS